MKLFILVDQEGITDIAWWPQPQLGGRDARDDERQRKAMAEDVNAIVRGARRAGAREFFVADFHGSAPPRVNMLPDDLDPEVRLFSGRSASPRGWDLVDGSYQGCVIAGMHARFGVADGVLSHNFTSVREIVLNGVVIGEIGYFALLAGLSGVPVILVTGDERACEEARGLLGDVETVATKKGYAHALALCPPSAQVRDALAAGAERAVRRIGEFRPFGMAPPYRLEVEMGGGRETRKADACCMFPFVERLSGTRVGYRSDDLRETLGVLKALFLMAGSGPAA